MKPGIKTTEFWTTAIQGLVGPIVMVLVAAGVFTADTDQQQLVEAINTNIGNAVEGVVAVVAQIGSVLAVRKYTDSREKVKNRESERSQRLAEQEVELERARRDGASSEKTDAEPGSQ